MTKQFTDHELLNMLKKGSINLSLGQKFNYWYMILFFLLYLGVQAWHFSQGEMESIRRIIIFTGAAAYFGYQRIKALKLKPVAVQLTIEDFQHMIQAQIESNRWKPYRTHSNALQFFVDVGKWSHANMVTLIHAPNGQLYMNCIRKVNSWPIGSHQNKRIKQCEKHIMQILESRDYEAV